MDGDSRVPATQERSLDPDDWDALRALGHRAFDDMIDYLRSIRERPVWRPIPDSTADFLIGDLPGQGMPADQVYEEIVEHVLPYPTGNIHPRFWSWVGGTGTPNQMIADLVISAMNAGGLGFDEAASTYVELQLLNWLKSLLDFPQDASGLLVSGGSMANLAGLAVARTSAAPYDVRQSGVDTANYPRLVYYASSETHSSVRKAVETLGLGNESLQLVPVRDDFTIDCDALRSAISADRAAGKLPACIVANVGTVNTAAIDDLDELARIAGEENLWLHADAAFGAFAKLSPQYRHLVDGLEHADSLAFDLHKWMYVQYDCGCVLVKSDKLHKDTFSVVPSYLRQFDRGLASGPLNFSEYGVQLSRSFKALRGWLSLKTEGADRLGEQVRQNIEQAAYLASLVDQHDDLQSLAPTALNIVNFRYVATELSSAALDDLNAEILMELHVRGIAAPSSTVLNGDFAIRVAICNHRSRRDDFRALVDGVRQIGGELAARFA